MMEGDARFDAPRPAVTSKLGKKRTDELIQADGDTWQEYLAVSEKMIPSTSNGSKRGGALSSIFGKKKKNSKDEPIGTGCLVVRSYYQNMRTGRKLWDEPPSGASIVIPASEEMRRMAQFQLGELYVSSSHESKRSPKGKKERSLLRRYSSSGDDNSTNSGRNSTNSGRSGRSARSARGSNGERRIRYKPDSKLNTARDSLNARGGRRHGKSLNERQLEEAIRRSVNDTVIPKDVKIEETEDEALRRVLEESRLEAVSSDGENVDNDHDKDDDRKPAARKTAVPKKEETEDEALRRVLEESRLEKSVKDDHNDDDDRKPAARKTVVPKNEETEEEILLRVLEESRLEAMSLERENVKDDHDEDDDRKPAAQTTCTETG